MIYKLENCTDYETYVNLIKNIILIQNHIEEMYDYSDIRNMRDLNDEFYKKEIEYWNEFKPKFDLLFIPFYNQVLNSKYKNKLLEVMPKNFFNLIECQLKITSDNIVELQQKENNLKTKYRELNRNKIMYNGKECTLSYVSSFFSSNDRQLRKDAHNTVNDYYYTKQKEYDSILFELINVRNEIAKRLGFDNYCVYSLYKLKRLGYDYKDIKKFRDNILKYIVPLCEKISEWQKEELSLEKLEYYDSAYFSEMPKTLYKGNELLCELKNSFKKIDLELYNLYKDMLDNNYIDLVSSDSKVNFSITNYLVEEAVPAITGNYKNSYLDVQTTMHEMGHSFQKYNAGIRDRKYIVSPLLKYPTFEIAEIFSYAMELISMDKVDNIFNEVDYNKYCFMKIYNLLSMLPYICLVDEFQEKIYSNDNLKVENIRLTWLSLAKKYKLLRTNSGHINLETGGYFYRQSHIYLDPFYYIDYALSYFGAFAMWDKCKDNLDLFEEIGAVASYYPFKELIQRYNMPNPFDEQTVKEIGKKLEKELIKRK